MTVLVGYTSEHGSTREIAQHIRRRLDDHGVQAEARSLEAVDDAAAYDSFVLGSAVHNMAWMPSAVEFVQANLTLLADRPVWLFSVGSKDSLTGPIGRRMAARYPIPKGIAELQEAVHPRDHRILTGVIARADFPWPSRLVLQAIGGHFGDFRDWPAIDGWADDIAQRLSQSPGAISH